MIKRNFLKKPQKFVFFKVQEEAGENVFNNISTKIGDNFEKNNIHYKLRKSNRIIIYRKPAIINEKDYFLEMVFEDG
jgi:hypothetical protein